MPRDLSRLLRPKTIAIVGGGAWCRAVAQRLVNSDFKGDLWVVHPKGQASPGAQVVTQLSDLPFGPDAVFIGINRDATIDVAAQVARMGAGGAVCFASGFAEVIDGQDRNAQLLAAAGDMPILGPNCYGYINALDGALLWPDQHGTQAVTKGVAILTQSSNIAINLTMQARGLPLAYVITCGNQAQTSQADIAHNLLDDPRVTAIGLHVEGFGDTADWERLARKAAKLGIPIIALKVGKSEQAQGAAISHTASLSGTDAAAMALLNRFGIARVDDITTLLEALKILHMGGPLDRGHIATISCSGGEASLAADLSLDTGLCFPPLNSDQRDRLADALGPRVALANPLDYHTYIWRDPDAMTQAFAAMIDPQLDLTILIVDFPRADRCDPSDWDCAINAAIAARNQTGGRIAMCATLPELMPEPVAAQLALGGVIPLSGLGTALKALDAATAMPPQDLNIDLIPPGPDQPGHILNEHQAKTTLAAFGMPIPAGVPTVDACVSLPFPVALKGMGFAHKSEHGAVALNLPDVAAVQAASDRMQAKSYLVEEMITDSIAELLIGITRDPAHGLVLTLGAGGVLTELLADTRHLMLPASDAALEQALGQLRVHRLLTGYRGKPPASIPAIVAAIRALQDYALANATHLQEAEINPLICTETRAVAADALIRIAHD